MRNRFVLGYYLGASVLYLGLARLSSLWTLDANTAQPFYPAAGAAVGLALRAPRKHRVAVAVIGTTAGVALNHLFLEASRRDLVIDIAANGLEAAAAILAAVVLLRRMAFLELPIAIAWVAVSVASAALGATVAVIGWGDTEPGTLFLRWSLGDGLGLFMIAPLFVLDQTIPLRPAHRFPLLELAGLCGLLALATIASFATTAPANYIILPILILVCFRGGSHFGQPAALAVVAYACVATANGFGPFSPSPTDSVIQVQAFTVAIALSTSATNTMATVATLRRARATAIVDALPDFVMLIDSRGNVVSTGTRPSEMEDLDIDALWPPDPDQKDVSGLSIEVRQGATEDQVIETRSVDVGDGTRMCVIRDISELVGQATALAESNDRWRRIVEASQDGIIEIDTDANLVYASDRFREIVGVIEGELVGLPLSLFTGEEIWEQVIESRLTARSGSPTVFEIGPVTVNEESRWGIISVSPQIDPDHGYVGSTLFVTDITSLKTAELERMKLLDNLAAVEREEQARLARDLHDGPLQDLTAVYMILDHLSQHDEPNELVSKATAAMADALAAIRSGVTELDPVEIEDGALAEALRRHAIRVAGANSIQVDLNTTADQPSGQTATQLYRIGREAINNAARHSNATRIGIDLENLETVNRLTVTDNGCGFSPDHRYGAGQLGLRSMHERARQAGGTITISSTPLAGTTVTVEIPIPSENGKNPRQSAWGSSQDVPSG